MNKQWILKSRPSGAFKLGNFELTETPKPKIEENQALLKTLYLSFDPTQRIWSSMDSYMPIIPLGQLMRAIGLGQVIESNNKKYKKGDIVVGFLGWQEYCLIDSSDQFNVIPSYIPLERILPLIGTGMTAYFGMLDIGKPKASETVVVSGAAGATGSIAGQIALIKGARVIGIAGGEEKCRWLIEKANFDAAIDYKNENVENRIRVLAPNGVDVYFDNVGGDTLTAVLAHPAQNFRVIMCGAISQYNSVGKDEAKGVNNLFSLIDHRGTMKGFIVTDYISRAMEAILSLNQWIDQGKIVQEITIAEGFENIPETLIHLFEGKNIGKQLLKLSDPPLPLNQNPIGRVLFNFYQSFIVWRKGNQ